MISDETRAEWRTLTDNASDGPWAQEHEGGYIVHGPNCSVLEAIYRPANAAFAAMARMAMPQLLDENEQLRAENAVLRERAAPEAMNKIGDAVNEFAAQLMTACQQTIASLGVALVEAGMAHASTSERPGVVADGPGPDWPATEPTDSLWGKGCPVDVWDGPYKMRCSLGCDFGTCGTHGKFADPPSTPETNRTSQ